MMIEIPKGFVVVERGRKFDLWRQVNGATKVLYGRGLTKAQLIQVLNQVRL